MVRLRLSGTTLRAPRLRASLIAVIQFGPPPERLGPRNLQTAAAPGTAMESANCAPAECWGPPSLDIIVLPPSREPQVGRTWPLRIFSSSGPLAVGGYTAEDADSGGCGIRTREGVNPTRSPSLRTDVLDGPQAWCGARGWAASRGDSDERWQVRLEPRLACLHQGRPDCSDH